MKLQLPVVFALSLFSVEALAQCARPEMSPIWDTDKEQFRCVANAGSEVSSHDEAVSPKGDKVFCMHAKIY
jgi:hypothetical protein